MLWGPRGWSRAYLTPVLRVPLTLDTLAQGLAGRQLEDDHDRGTEPCKRQLLSTSDLATHNPGVGRNSTHCTVLTWTGDGVGNAEYVAVRRPRQADQEPGGGERRPEPAPHSPGERTSTGSLRVIVSRTSADTHSHERFVQLKEELEALRKAMSENADGRPQSRGLGDGSADTESMSRSFYVDPTREKEVESIREQLEEHQRLLRESEVREGGNLKH